MEQGLQQQINPVQIEAFPPAPPSHFASASHVQVALQRHQLLHHSAQESDITLSQLQFSVIRQMESLTQMDAEIQRLSEQISSQMTQLLRDQSQLWTLFLASTRGSLSSNGASLQAQQHPRPEKSKSRSPQKRRATVSDEKQTSDQVEERPCTSSTGWVA